MATLNSAVYTDGITATFLNPNKLYAVCLLDASNNIIATSAAIKYLAIPDDGYITSVLSWASESKQLIVSALDFTKTKSIVVNDTVATQFAIVEVSAVSSEKSEAYAHAGTSYYWPTTFGTQFVTGSLTSSTTISENNNFRFDSILIKFSEADNV